MSKRQEALIIAKLAYKEITQAMEDFQNRHKSNEIDFCWDDYLWVDGESFSYYEMREEKNG